MSDVRLRQLLIVIGIAIATLALAAGGAFTTSDEQAMATLRQAGFTDAVPGESEFWACGDGDKWWGRSFAARNAQGATVHGTVCCGIIKACTVRF